MGKGLIGSLRVRLGLDSAEFQRGVRQAQRELKRFVRRAKLAAAAAAGAAAGGLSLLVKQSFAQVDASAKLAKSLGTTTKAVQALQLAATYSGVGISQLESTMKDFTRRLSQAADEGGPVAKALKRIGLSAKDLLRMPLDQRVAAVTEALRKYVPAAQRAAVAGKIFGEEGSIAALRIDSETIRQAAREIDEFGVAVSRVDAAKIEAANDAVARIGLALRGLGNRIAVKLAPTIERTANALANAFREGGPLSNAIQTITDQVGRIASYTAAAAAVIGGRFAAAMAVAAAKVMLAGKAVQYLRAALIRTGIGAIVVLLGEMIYRFGRLTRKAGGFGAALGALKDVALEVIDRIKRSFALMGEAIWGVAEGIKAAFAGAFATILEGFSSMTGAIAKGINRLFEGLGLDSPNLSGIGAEAAKELRAVADYWKEAGPEFWKSWRSSFADLGAPLESLRKMKEAVAETNNELANGRGAADGFGNALAVAGGKGKSALDKVKDAAQEVKSALGSAFRDLIKGAKSFQDALAGVLDKLADMAIDAAFNTLWENGLSKLFSGLFGSIFGSADGNVFRGGMPVRAFAAGGVVDAPTLFPMQRGVGLMGEAGPEAIMPLERVGGKLGVRAVGGSGEVTVRIIIDKDGNIVPVVERVAGRVSAQITEAAIDSYDRTVLPGRLATINPRRAG